MTLDSAAHFLLITFPRMPAQGPGPVFLSGWGALASFVILATVGAVGWRWLWNRNRGRIEDEKAVRSRVSRVKRRMRR
jgi:hypothetical protein